MDAKAKRKSDMAALPLALALAGASWAATVPNPVLWADIPDPSIVRVGGDYYMSHTTMHMAPGVPIMKSSDLVNWKTVSYCYSTLVNNDEMNMANGKNAYGKGSWASSIRHKDGVFHVLVPSYTSGKTHLYTTSDVEKGPWKEVQFPFYHDPSLWLDDDGRNFVVYGGSDIWIVQLNSALTAEQSRGVRKILISSSSIKNLLGDQSPILVGEGSHVEKIDGWYYVFLICWPKVSGFDGRTEIVFRSKTIDGTYEGKVVHSSKGVAQGSVVQAPDGKWWGYLFQDNGSVGRSPWIMPVTWQNGWPSFNGGTSPATFSIETGSSVGTGIVTSDEFSTATIKPEWQWNHNSDDAGWSLSKRPGFLRLTTGRVDAQVVGTKNVLTQRSFGPKSSGRVALDVSGLKDGDVAGLVALQYGYGYVAVKKTGSTNSVVMVNASGGTPSEVATAPLSGSRVYLRIDMDFANRTDKATFFWSSDSASWKQIGNTLQMSYKLEHFVGYRFGLFHQATKSAGGVSDFDWFRIGADATRSIDLYPVECCASVERTARPTGRILTYSWMRSELRVRHELSRAGSFSLRLVAPDGTVAAELPSVSREAGQHVEHLRAQVAAGQYLVEARLDGRLLESGSVVVAH